MTELSIVLSKYTKGLCAWIEDQDDGNLTIHANRCTDDAESVCRHAAEKLRLLANAFDILATMDRPYTPRAQEAALAAAKQRGNTAQPEPEEPTDEDIMRLMPQQMHEDLAAAARALAEQASTISPSATGIMRIMLNRHAVDLARAVLARWGRSPQ